MTTPMAAVNAASGINPAFYEDGDDEGETDADDDDGDYNSRGGGTKKKSVLRVVARVARRSAADSLTMGARARSRNRARSLSGAKRQRPPGSSYVPVAKRR